MTTITIKPNELKAKWPKVRTASNVNVILDGKEFRLPHTLDILGKNVVVKPKSGRPKLFADGSLMAHFSCGKSSSNVKVCGLMLDSHDAYKQRPNGFMLHGAGIHVYNVQGQNLKDFCNFTGTARNVLIDTCMNTGQVDGYFAYAKGKNITLRDCVANRALAGFVRVNECVGLTIDGCESFGVPDDEETSFFVGRIQLQFVSDVTIRNTTLHNALLTTGALWNIDGWNQRKSDADFFARRTKDVVAENLEMDDGWIEVRYGSENVKINTVGLPPVVKYPKPDSKLPAWVRAKLAAPKDIWINGEKTR